MCIELSFCNHYLSLINTFKRQGKDPDPDPVLSLKDLDADLGGPKTNGSYGSEALFSFNDKIWINFRLRNCRISL
jgi:hypothetical protein